MKILTPELLSVIFTALMVDGGLFGQTLRDFRNHAKLKQEELGEAIGVSGSYIGMLESGGRGKENPVTREEAWKLIEKLNIFPPKLDKLLESAGLSPFRSEVEELRIQQNYPDLKELWIFTKVIRDVDDIWYPIVKENIVGKRSVKYTYFTTTPTKCRKLFNRLSREGVKKEILNKKLECFIFPEKLFMANFAIYNPAEKDRYCCGAVFENGKPTSFYTYEKTEAELMYLILDEWRTNILENDYIRLANAYEVPLDDSDERPAIKHSSAFTQEFRYSEK